MSTFDRTQNEEMGRARIRKMREKGLDIGMRVDVLVSESDVHSDDGGGGFFVCPFQHQQSNGELARYSGRVLKIQEDSFVMEFGWNVTSNKPLKIGSVNIEVYGESVIDYTLDAVK